VRVVFLGTGTSQGVPVIACPCKVCSSDNPHDKRLRSSILIGDGETVVVIDSGPDFRQQMLLNGVKRLSALVFTHDHKDHIAGMDDIRAFNFVNRSAVDVFASVEVQESLKREFPYVFEDLKYPGVPEINMHTIYEESFSIGGLDFLPLPVLHYRLPVNGYRVGDFSYITDANHIPDETMRKLSGTRVLVINALRHEKHISHFNLEEALAIIEKVNPEQAYLTHISHQLGRQMEIDSMLPTNVKCSFDGLELSI